jgi:hypothetical protein
MKLRAKEIFDLYLAATVNSGKLGLAMIEYERRWEFIRALHEVELAGIKVDVEFATKSLQEASWSPADQRALRSIIQLNRNGFVTSLFNPLGGATGRVKTEGGFNSMGIPHGLIFSFDFNAIDYRCIVNAIGGDFAKLYEGAQDFHQRTTQIVFTNITPEIADTIRDAMKAMSYIHFYGGSAESVAAKTGLPIERIRWVLQKMDERLGPIREFRESLLEEAKKHAWIKLPNGYTSGATEADGSIMHAGKILGRFAQSYSSTIFERAFVRVHEYLKTTKSHIIFPVHDELVIDMHADDVKNLVPMGVQHLMQMDGFSVKHRSGKNYGEATD